MHTLDYRVPLFRFSPREVNKYSTFIFLTRARSLGLRGGADCPKQKTPQEDSASSAAGKKRVDGFPRVTSQSGCRSTSREIQSEESVRVQDRGRGIGVRGSYLASAVPGSISSLSHRTGSETGRVLGGPAEVRSRSELRGGRGVKEVKGHRAVEVIFFIPRRWARLEQPTGSRTGETFLLRAE